MSGEWSSKQNAPKGKNHKKHFVAKSSGGSGRGGGGARDYANRGQSEGDRDIGHLLTTYGICGRKLEISEKIQTDIYDTLKSVHFLKHGDTSRSTDEDTAAASKRRAKEMAKLEKEVKKQEEATRDAMERQAKIGTSTKVRVVVCTGSLAAGPRKTLVVPRVEGSLKELLKMVKNKINAKPHKLKKPERAFVFLNGDESSDPTEISDTKLLLDDEIVVVTEKGGLVEDDDSHGGKKDKKLSKKDKKAAKKEAKKAKKAAKKAAKQSNNNSDEGGAENSASDDVDPLPESSVQDDALATSMSQMNLDSGSTVSIEPNRQRTRAAILDPSASAGLLDDATEKRASNAAFRKMLRARAMLPAHEKRDMILAAVAEHQVVVVSGDTGCGKTTQIPQFILDDAIKRGKGGECSIVCTQPRRISAIGVAERVAAERCEPCGDVVGYQIRLQNKTSRRTRLKFCTIGILLRRMVADKSLADVSHLVIDEVHERDILSDFLLAILRSLLQARPDLRVVLMSATLNASLFVEYFSKLSSTSNPVAVPCIDIPGRTFPVKAFFLEDVVDMVKYSPAPEHTFQSSSGGKKGVGSSPQIADQRHKRSWVEAMAKQRTAPSGKPKPSVNAQALQIVGRLDENRGINYDLIEKLVVHICTAEQFRVEVPGEHGAANGGGALGGILIFLTGVGEVTRLCRQLESHHALANSSKFRVLPLHSALPAHVQSKVFDRVPAGCRKIVVATNIAETSITIDDIVFVVNAGRVKEVQVAPSAAFSSLVETWASQAANKQRQGRAGRVRSGICFHMFSSFTRDRRMLAHQVPEIQRQLLDEIVLQIMLLGLGTDHSADALSNTTRTASQQDCESLPAAAQSAVMRFLQATIEPPEQKAILAAEQRLLKIGAIEVIEQEESAVNVQLQLTPLGVHLSSLPLSPSLGKMLVFGTILRCIDPVLTIAAMLSSKSPLSSIVQDRERVRAVRDRFAAFESDLILLVPIFNDYQQLVNSSGSPFSREVRSFCREYCLSTDAMNTIARVRDQFTSYLVSAGLLSKAPRQWRNGGSASTPVTAAEGNLGGFGTASEFSDDLVMVRCAIVAGLYPNVVGVGTRKGFKGKRSFTEYLTEHAVVRVHPGSVNFSFKLLRDADREGPSAAIGDPHVNTRNWVVYFQRMVTSQDYLFDTTVVDGPTLLMFGTGKIVYVNNELRMDNWISFQTEPLVFVEVLFANALYAALICRVRRLKLYCAIKQVQTH
eukprot:INCI9223.2.p1 GENE.INCI9223.2~~INCI9223.2.p1  ORF type:complete len:1234 (-),score=254.77 INCI9223.2:661-4362(-)